MPMSQTDKSRKDADERSGYVHFVLTPMGNK